METIIIVVLKVLVLVLSQFYTSHLGNLFQFYLVKF